MKSNVVWLALGALAIAQPFILVHAQESEPFDLKQDLRERGEQYSRLSLEEKLKMRAAVVKAEEDPAVKEALAKRNAAILEYRAAMRASMIQNDPTIVPLLDKVASGTPR